MLSKQASHLRRGAAIAACAFATALAFPPAYAADPPPKKPAANTTTKSKANVMTRDELRACMDDQDRLQQASGSLQQEVAALDRQGNDVKALDAELASKRAAVEAANAANAAANAAAIAAANAAKAADPAKPVDPAKPAKSPSAAAVDRAVEELKTVATRRDDAADAYNAQLKALREKSAAIETQRQGWTERCTTKGYDEMDEAAIRLERKRAGAATK
ncbi:MAG: hypothetical protein OEW98_12455 [Betaproteobacteria bacterium]|nr:hypothetical protein [Betaproteobacteria bacterium]